MFYHFIGATPQSTDVFQVLSRFFMEHMPKGTKIPEDVAEMMRFSRTMFETATEQALKDGKTNFIVIIDALNQMDDEGKNQDEPGCMETCICNMHTWKFQACVCKLL